jgi:hypothetical protein
MKGADKLRAQVPDTKTRKNICIRMGPETFSLRVTAERILP